ncbi:hypothetical protein [Arthrobacter koreensis]|uniref:hypothetical protein n=1 Tax=Arthrobacter koreensis TaxID=199136 RepID=UPI002DBCB8D9|nr:hypothetical protein [Arthrobacter koreensis]MEB7505826.1 hypothetical protein [Arthrobacter koreensis]
MTTPPATPRSSGAGLNSLTSRIMRPGPRRPAQDGQSAGDLSSRSTDSARAHPPEAASGQPRPSGRLLGWTRFPDAVIQLALSSPATRRPGQDAAATLPAVPDAQPGNSGPAPAPAADPRPARPAAQPRPAAKTPPRPGHPPTPAETPHRPPRITDRRTRRPAPLAINAAALLITAGGVVGLIAGLRAAMDPERPAPQAAAQLAELRVPVETILSLARIADVAVAAVAFGLFLLMASLVRDGRSWSRPGTCVLVAAALFFGFRDDSFAHVAAALLAGIGAGMLFLPPSGRYFATRGGRTS